MDNQGEVPGVLAMAEHRRQKATGTLGNADVGMDTLVTVNGVADLLANVPAAVHSFQVLDVEVDAVRPRVEQRAERFAGRAGNPTCRLALGHAGRCCHGPTLNLVSAADGLVLPWNAAGGLRALRVVTDAEQMQRRMFLTLLGATLTAPAHDWLLAYAAEDTAHATGTDLPVEIIDELDLITAGLRRMDDQLGGGNLQPLVSVHLRAVIDLIENRHYNESTGRRLHATAAELLRLGGFLAFDAGHHAQAQRYWVAALHTAHAAADRGLGANILGFMSCQAKDLGQTRQAITLAETARSGYPVTVPRVQAILDLRAAEAYAVGADLSNCRRAIDAALNRFSDPTPDHGEPGWSYWLDIPHAHGQAGYCYLRLGEWDAARRHLRAAIQGQGVTISREGALRQVLMATTYVRQTHPDIEKGLDLGNRALDTLTQQVSSARVIGHVSRLSDYLAPYRQNPAVKAFNNRTREITRSRPAT